MNPPTVVEVDRISDVADPVVRNLQITQCYHELSTGMRRFTGGAANWCTFATWASRQAGQTIRQEDLVRAFQEFADRAPEMAAAVEMVVGHAAPLVRGRDVDALRDGLRQALDPQAAFEQAGDAVARGNRKVFEEIGREFARFLAVFDEDTAPDTAKVAQFCAGLRQGEPPDGQRLLREAFAAYAEARFLSDGKARAELTYYANLLIGFHEQTRLQPEIAEALNAPSWIAETMKPRLLAALLPGFWLHLRLVVARLLGVKLPLDEALDRLVRAVQSQVRQVVTQSVMTLHLPGGKALRLGRDLEGEFPAALAQISDPRLQAVLTRVDPTPRSLAETGATDWADFDERMHLIADLFRAYHERTVLFDAPFSAEQTDVLKAGRRPAGPL
jgi:hypothetical protein